MKQKPPQYEVLVKEVVGDEVVQLLRVLGAKRNVSEFKLAEKLKLNINQVRHLLYKMHEHNLVTSTRRKDKKKGWYIYYWTFHVQEAKALLTIHQQTKLERLKKELVEESTQDHFICKSECLRLTPEEALENEFKCPECGEVMVQEVKEKHIEELKKQIAYLEQEMTAQSQEQKKPKNKTAKKNETKKKKPIRRRSQNKKLAGGKS